MEFFFLGAFVRILKIILDGVPGEILKEIHGKILSIIIVVKLGKYRAISGLLLND